MIESNLVDLINDLSFYIGLEKGDFDGWKFIFQVFKIGFKILAPVDLLHNFKTI
jgi:hypothetical protein